MPTNAARWILIAGAAGILLVIAVIFYGLRSRKVPRGFDILPPNASDKSPDER
jgi:hypothetical protein